MCVWEGGGGGVQFLDSANIGSISRTAAIYGLAPLFDQSRTQSPRVLWPAVGRQEAAP